MAELTIEQRRVLALARARRRRAQNPEPINADPTEGMTFTDQVRAGAGKAFMDVGRGIGQRLGMRDAEDTRRDRELDAPLMDTPGGKYGQFAGPIAATAPIASLRALNTLKGATSFGGAYGAAQPTESGSEAAKNTVMGAGLGLGGQYGGQKLAGWLGDIIGGRLAKAAAEKEANAVRDQTLTAAREAGYVVPPASANPTATNRTIESIGGKIATQQDASLANQTITDQAVRAELKLATGTPITRETLRGVRQDAGKVYQQIENAGEIVPDGQYLDDLAGIERSIAELAQDFPDANVGANEQIRGLVNSLLRDRFSSKSALEYTKQLRKAAAGNLSGANAADPTKRALGAAQRDAAAALEEQMLRHLNATGRGEIATAFDEARRRIAIAHTVERSLNESTGEVVAKGLAGDLKRGKPLSGALETAARTAQAFPKAMQRLDSSPSSLVNYGASLGAGGGVGIATGNPILGLIAAAGVPASRVGARKLALSDMFQNRMLTPKYAPNPLMQMLLKGGVGTGRRGGPLAAVTGVTAGNQ